MFVGLSVVVASDSCGASCGDYCILCLLCTPNTTGQAAWHCFLSYVAIVGKRYFQALFLLGNFVSNPLISPGSQKSVLMCCAFASQADMSCTVIQQVKKNDSIYRKEREEHHIRRDLTEKLDILGWGGFSGYIVYLQIHRIIQKKIL